MINRVPSVVILLSEFLNLTELQRRFNAFGDVMIAESCIRKSMLHENANLLGRLRLSRNVSRWSIDETLQHSNYLILHYETQVAINIQRWFLDFSHYIIKIVEVTRIQANIPGYQTRKSIWYRKNVYVLYNPLQCIIFHGNYAWWRDYNKLNILIKLV